MSGHPQGLESIARAKVTHRQFGHASRIKDSTHQIIFEESADARNSSAPQFKPRFWNKQHLTDFQGNVSQSFGELVHRQEENALALDGYMVRSMGGIVYTGKYLGVLAAFSREGRLSYLVQTIAPPPYPTLMSEGQRKWLRHGPILASLALAAGEDTLFVLARRRVSFSLDSLDRNNFKKITGRDGLDSVLASIQMARELGFEPVKVNAVVIRDINFHEIEALGFMAPYDSGTGWE